MKTLNQLLETGYTGKLFLIKKGKRYITIRSGELAFTTKQRQALAGTCPDSIESFLQSVTVDTRNAKVVGSSYQLVPITIPHRSVPKS